MYIKKLFLSLSILFYLFNCNYIPLIQEPEPKQDIEPLLAAIVLVNNALGFLNFEFSSCSGAESIGLNATKTGTLLGQKMKFFRLTGPGAGTQTVNIALNFTRKVSGNLEPAVCLVVGKENRNIDTEYSFTQVDLPSSTSSFSNCSKFYSVVMNASPNYRCIGIEAYEDIDYTLTSRP